MTPDPAQVAAQITGCRKSAFSPYVDPYCAEHHSDPAHWPCPVLDDATEVVRAALAQAWDEGLRHGCANNGNYENNNPYTEHRMIAGSHESPWGAECRCGAAWDRWVDQCVKVLQDQELTKSDFDALETTDDVAEALWEQAHKTPATKSFKRTKR